MYHFTRSVCYWLSFNFSFKLNCFTSEKSCTMLCNSFFFFWICFLFDLVHNSFKICTSVIISSIKENISSNAPIAKHSEGNITKLVENVAAQVKTTTHKQPSGVFQSNGKLMKLDFFYRTSKFRSKIITLHGWTGHQIGFIA